MVICLIILYEFMPKNTICKGQRGLLKPLSAPPTAQSHGTDLRAVDTD